MSSPSREKVTLAGWFDRLITGLFLATLGWVLWHLGGAMGRSMAIGFAGAMLLVALVVLRWWVIQPTGAPRAWWWPLPMLFYVGLHAAGLSATPGRAVMEALHFIWLVAGYWSALHLVRLKEPRGALWFGVGALTVVMAGAAFYQRAIDPNWLPMGRQQSAQYLERSSGLLGVPNNLAAWMLVVLPPAWWLFRRHLQKRPGAALTAGVVGTAAMAALILTLSRGGWIALVLAMTLWAALGSRASWWRRGLAATGIAALAAILAAAAYHKLPTVQDRVDTMIHYGGERTRPMMWAAAWKLWQDAPWLGTGGGSYEALLERHRPAAFRDGPKWAHNDYLNTLSDYGLVGFALSWGVAAVGVAFVTRSRRRVSRALASMPEEECDRRSRRDEGWRTAVGVGLCGLLAATMVDFHLHIPAVAWLAALAAAEWLGGRQRGDVAPRGPVRPGFWRIAVVGTSGVAVFVLTALALPRFQADEARFRGRELTDKLAKSGSDQLTAAEVEPIVALFAEATRLAPEHELGWTELAMALALRAHAQPARGREIGAEAEAAARRALALCDQEAMAWVRLGVALDLQDRWVEGGRAFGQALKLAPNNALVWYYQAFHFSLQPTTHALARGALATCLRLDGGIPQAKALQAALERSRL